MSRLARALVQLIGEVNNKYPDRPKSADGTYGDTAHAARVSDHNPNSAGVVTAWDITTAPWSDKFALWLARKENRRVKYVIWDHGIWTPEKGWHRYDGDDPHVGHIHLSLSADPSQYDRTDLWNVGTYDLDDDMTPAESKMLAETHAMLKQLVAPRRPDKQDIDPQHLSLADLYTLVEQKV
jgi:hypothetical protein